jgi:hypothetical protein
MNSAASECVRHCIRLGRQRIFKPFALGRVFTTDLQEMKLLVKKKTNPAFKRLQVIPPLPDLPVCHDRVKKYAAAPAVVIVAPRPEARLETSSLCA